MIDDTHAPEDKSMIIYQDDDLVYVDPQARTVVGRVEFNLNGKPKLMPLPSAKIAVEPSNLDEKEDTIHALNMQIDSKKGRAKNRSRVPRVRYCPWGTYRSMKRVFKLEGKTPRIESQKTLEEVLEKALQEPFWD